MTTQSVEAIIEAICNLPLKEALIYLIAHGIKDFASEGYSKLKKIIQDKQNESQYAFVHHHFQNQVLLVRQAILLYFLITHEVRHLP